MITVLAALLLTPGMICLIPGMQMTAEEHECCQHMGADCGKAPMPSAMRCCQVEHSGVAVMAPGKALPQADIQMMLVEAGFEPALPVSTPAATSIDTGPELVPPVYSSAILRI